MRVKNYAKLAVAAVYASWQKAQQAIQEIIEVITGFAELAKEAGVSKNTPAIIKKALEERRHENRGLLR
ncbi:hypothetical protein AB833_11065 [Chromatiales bacterium (ex Bugula neritina AB1)]|nr:hypothetical protein AB833_11065 [Chromatiales bacterium (ex Bugula neritina AB1)]